MGITMVRNFVQASGPATIEDVLDHIDHVAKLVGVEHVGIGSDVDLDGRDTRIRPRKRFDLDGVDYSQKIFDLDRRIDSPQVFGRQHRADSGRKFPACAGGHLEFIRLRIQNPEFRIQNWDCSPVTIAPSRVLSPNEYDRSLLDSRGARHCYSRSKWTQTASVRHK